MKKFIHFYMPMPTFCDGFTLRMKREFLFEFLKLKRIIFVNILQQVREQPPQHLLRYGSKTFEVIMRQKVHDNAFIS